MKLSNLLFLTTILIFTACSKDSDISSSDNSEIGTCVVCTYPPNHEGCETAVHEACIVEHHPSTGVDILDGTWICGGDSYPFSGRTNNLEHFIEWNEADGAKCVKQ